MTDPRPTRQIPPDRSSRAADQGDDPSIDAALRGLLVPAPSTLLPSTLIAVGLADGYARVESPIGPMFVAYNGLGISAIAPAEDPSAFEARFAREFGRPAHAVDALPTALGRAVARRIAGDRRASVPLDLRGRTSFERAVWEKALQIPRGEVRPYGWIAAEIGRPRAVRAVGSALGRNPVPLVIPCHRVVRTDGYIGQYALGTDRKRVVLDAEGVDVDRLEALAQAGVRLIGSDTTHIACLPTCHNARRIRPEHEVPFHSLREAASAGYRACRECRPTALAA
jgi:O-6-methylguanine DNA methyltransferase